MPVNWETDRLGKVDRAPQKGLPLDATVGGVNGLRGGDITPLPRLAAWGMAPA